MSARGNAPSEENDVLDTPEGRQFAASMDWARVRGVADRRTDRV